MTKKIQVLLVHGGMTFKSDEEYVQWLKTRDVSLEKKVSWTGEYLEKSLGKRYEIISPRMPCADNAQYREWEICFERHIPFLTNDFILIGSSLGGVFLAKYLAKHTLPKRALSVYLVCPPFDSSLSDEDLTSGFALTSKADLSLIEKNAKNVHLLFSEDDDVVPVAHAEKYRKKLSKAQIIIYKNKNGHFKITTFPEIVKLIKGDVKGL